MPKSRELTVFERGMIIGLHKGKHNATDIQKILGINRTTCIAIINKFENDGLTEPLPRSGRPPLLTEREERTLVRVTKDNRKELLEEITELFNSLGLTRLVLVLLNVYFITITSLAVLGTRQSASYFS